ncbi:MAG TPA: hypothetical protein VH599_20335 [Ktedonobacterales bacterium]
MGIRFFAQAASIILALALALVSLSLSGISGHISHAQPASSASIGGCPLFPANNIWNRDISALPVAANSANIIASIGLSGHLHPDFGAGLYQGQTIGIPYIVVPNSQPGVKVSFDYAGESDPGPYPIPANAPIEGGASSSGDRHVLVVQSGACKLYEMYASYPQSDGSWKAGSGAVWSLNSNALRPRSWTSADAAGLPILPGLARYDEVASGVISHALRFTVQHTQDTFVWPARHQASSLIGANYPPMGTRLRLKASVNIASFSAQNRVILTALKRYGMMVADNGSNWYISGAPDSRWNNDDLAQLAKIPGSDFEVVNTASLAVNPNSGAAAQPAAGTPTPTATGQASPTTSPTAGFPSATPDSSQTIGASGDPHSNRAADSSANIRMLLIFILGSLGIVLLIVLGIRRRLQEVRRLTAEARQDKDAQPPP